MDCDGIVDCDEFGCDGIGCGGFEVGDCGGCPSASALDVGGVDAAWVGTFGMVGGRIVVEGRMVFGIGLGGIGSGGRGTSLLFLCARLGSTRKCGLWLRGLIFQVGSSSRTRSKIYRNFPEHYPS